MFHKSFLFTYIAMKCILFLLDDFNFNILGMVKYNMTILVIATMILTIHEGMIVSLPKWQHDEDGYPIPPNFLQSNWTAVCSVPMKNLSLEGWSDQPSLVSSRSSSWLSKRETGFSSPIKGHLRVRAIGLN